MNRKKTSYTKKRISELTGMTQRQVQFYTEQGVVTPEIDQGEGRGKTRLYSEHNFVQFMIIKGLTELGMTIGKIKPILLYINQREYVHKYEEYKLHESDHQFFIKIFKKDDGTMAGNWMLTGGASDSQYILKPNEIIDIDECIVINFGRIAAKAAVVKK
jgi:DNA-binding transcriptional MerR regulator